MSADWERSTGSPSEDTINPAANAWISRDASGRLSETDSQEPSPATRRTRAHVQSAHVQALARSVGEDPEALASKISPDLLRRLKFPVHVTVNADGTRTYAHDIGVREGLQSGRGTDHAADGEAAPAPREARRDSSGKFAPKPL